jgi:hypothetical protein
MGPLALTNYLTVSAGVGATLIGLIFVAVSIAPERTVMEGAPLERQAVAASAFSALSNGFFISFFGLLSSSAFTSVTILMSSLGLSSISLLIVSLVRHREGGLRSFVRRLTSLLASIVLYIYELFEAIALVQQPRDTSAAYTIAVLLGCAYAVGLLRAWQLLGARRFGLSSLLMPSKETDEQKSDVEQVVP